jgi:NAD(P)-dependent dehydrogenase (short-subunit alcohol dehydrogenase family)
MPETITASREARLEGLAGRRVLITGANGGIGRALVRAFAAAGCQLVLFGRSPGIADLASELGDGHLGIAADLSDEAQVVNAFDRSGAIDILINNAAIAPLGPALDYATSDFDASLAINLRAPFILARQAAVGMLERGWGRIINIASQAAVIAIEEHVAYCASKAGLVGLTQVLAIEWGGRGVTVNAISPTIVATEMAKRNWAGAKGDAARKAIPTGRFVTPEEVALAVRFIASDGAAMINGANLIIDGGNTIR